MENGYEAVVELLAMIAAFFLSAWFVMLCWNAIVPTIFGLTLITYKQSAIFLVLCNLLFKSGPSKD